MHPALLLRHGHALHAVHAAFVLELAVHFVAANQRDHFLQPAHWRFAAGRYFKFPALRLAVPRVHAKNLGREQRCLIAAGSGADFEHHVLFVVRILRQQQDLELLLDLEFFRFELGHLLLRHRPELAVGILKHGPGLRKTVLDLLPLSIFGDYLGNLALGFGDVAVLVRIADHGRIGHLASELVEALFKLFELRNELHGGIQASLRRSAYAITSSPPCDASTAMAPSRARMATAVWSS